MNLKKKKFQNLKNFQNPSLASCSDPHVKNILHKFNHSEMIEAHKAHSPDGEQRKKDSSNYFPPKSLQMNQTEYGNFYKKSYNKELTSPDYR